MYSLKQFILFCSMALVIILFNSIDAFCKVYLDIDSPAFEKFPIAITDFEKSDGTSDRENLSSWLSDALANSLNTTGFFNIIDKKAFLESEKQPASPTERINYADWSAIGAEYLAKGNFKYGTGELTAEFRLYDVIKGELLIGKKYTGGFADRKDMVQRFAGEVFFHLTGEKGIFDTKIAFIIKKGRMSDIYAVNFDGSGLTRITNCESIAMSPRWSPDGGKISFTSFKEGNADLYIIDLKSRQIRKIADFKGLNLSGSWSPDGKNLLLTLSKDGNEEIYIMELADRQLKRLTNNYSIDVSPAWSPDGRQIAFVSNRSGSPQIYMMDAEGGNVRRITFEGSYNTSPSWSPRGNRIAYEGQKNGLFQIFTVEEDGSNPLQLTFDDGNNESPVWSPDGRYLTFSSKIKGRQMIRIMNANGSNKRVVYGGSDGYMSPSWSPY